MAEVRNQKGISRQILLITLWLTLLMLVVKVGAAWATRSLAIVAESLHTVIDGFSTVLSLIAISAPNRQTGREVWGHGRLETGLALLLVALLGFAGLSLLSVAVGQLAIDPALRTVPATRMRLSVIGLLGVVYAASLGLALFERKVSRSLDSSVLKLNARHILQDAWLTAFLLVGLFGMWAGYAWFDSFLTIVMVLTAGLSCWRVLNWQLPLMVRQVAIAPEAIGQIVRQIQGVTQCYEVRSRGIVGRQVFVEMRVIVHPEFLGASDWIVEEIEGAIRDRYGPVQVMIFIEEAQDELQHPFEQMRSDQSSREIDWS
ncbi:cation diffusion facilitator family transporter [Leptolyngbya sp. NIES-2104]|uniref:cation diffusion facilitator family transporter n=1 Tax=Leptolyngbya sp. NIES-2104 TaxID=1552121 RepID=UPI0006EC9D34|nr:cation diffusion facilitator family transporter [Leptolyngbya sp. NIES-2104]GAP94642.1 cobalt-zinc-cadmium resistance protein [Leptolyngbya sp. NIES-2104]